MLPDDEVPGRVEAAVKIGPIARIIALALGIMTASAAIALAASQDYRFEGVQTIVGPSQIKPVTVRLLHAPTGTSVTGASITRSEVYMPMNGMAAMHGTVTARPPDSSGLLRFLVNVPMSGPWLLDITARIAAERTPLHGTVVLYVETPHRPATERTQVPDCIEDRPSLYDDC